MPLAMIQDTDNITVKSWAFFFRPPDKQRTRRSETRTGQKRRGEGAMRRGDGMKTGEEGEGVEGSGVEWRRKRIMTGEQTRWTNYKGERRKDREGLVEEER